MPQSPVLIVGAGPAGLVLGIELARRGVPLHLIDRRPEPLGRDRAIVLKSRTLELLAGIGLAETFLRHGRIIKGVDLFSGAEKVASVGLEGLDSPFPFDLCLPEEVTERLLTDELERLGVRIERGVEFLGLEQGERGVSVVLRSQDDGERRLDVAWLVGADGLRSAVRGALGDAFEGHDYPTLWGVADAQLVAWPRPTDRATVQIEPPVVIAFPLQDGRWRFTFQPDAADSEVLRTVEARLRAIAPGATLLDPDEPALFRTHGRVARRFRIGRVLLVGDAAHASTPFEGHGMNAGMQDSQNLGWKLALVATGAAPEALLNSYEAERRPVAQAINLSGDDAEARARRDPTARRALMTFLAAPEGRRLAAIAESELAFGYDQSPIVDEVVSAAPTPASGTRVGYRVGDAAPLEGQDRSFRLHELIGGPAHILLLLLGETEPAAVSEGLALVRAAARRCRPHVEAYVVVRSDRADGSIAADLLHDPTGALHHRLGADRPSLCMVRPDGHLGFRSEPPSLEALEAHLARILCPA